MVEFAGWHMPVQYKTGLIAEHKAVRQAAGLFDVSHMGQLDFRGPGAVAMVNGLITNDLERIPNGKAQYTAICNDDGGILDDGISYRLADDHVMMVVNASNTPKIVAWFRERAQGDAEFTDVSDEWALFALQGPRAADILPRVIPGAEDMGAFEVRQLGDAIIATTGYTGEAGYEIFVPAAQGADIWAALLAAGTDFGILPVGLGARDTLRLESKMCLYGNDIDESTNPIEAGIGWAVKTEKATGFIGQEALRAVKAGKTTRRLVGLILTARGIARHGYPVHDQTGQQVGRVTSGTMSPTLGEAIALAYVDKPHHKVGTPLNIAVRKRMVACEVAKTPFYRRAQD